MTIRFGSNGWRAVISDEFTFENVRRLMTAVVVYIKDKNMANKPVVVGYDTRFQSDKYAQVCVKVFHENGIECLLTERDTPTPVVSYTVREENASLGVMVTASHNASNFSGIKLIDQNGAPANILMTDEIVKKIPQICPVAASDKKEIVRIYPRHRYFEHLKDLLDVDIIQNAKLKVAYDPFWGTGRGYLDHILSDIGVQVVTSHNYRDVLFGGIKPEANVDTMNELGTLVVKNGCSVGLATDPDADRFAVCDENGKFVSANIMLPLLLEHLINNRKERGAIVRSLATTHLLDKIAEKHGLPHYETAAGFKHIAEVMMREPVILGCEETGGMAIIGHIPEKDGILANLLFCEMLAVSKKPLSKMVEDLYSKYGVLYNKKINLPFEKDKKRDIMVLLSKEPPIRAGALKLKSVGRLDGIKLLYEDGSWMLARASGTENIIRLYFESDSEKKIDEMLLSFQSFAGSIF